MARCPRCRFIFDGGTPGLLPACPQCGGATENVVRIEPTKAPREAPTPPRTLKLPVLRTPAAS